MNMSPKPNSPLTIKIVKYDVGFLKLSNIMIIEIDVLLEPLTENYKSVRGGNVDMYSWCITII